MADNSILDKAKVFVKDYLDKHLDDRFTFHNWDHCLEVVQNAKQIANGSNISDEQLEIVELAAWFHDLGYMVDTKNHEPESCKLAEAFLQENNYPQEKIEEVKSCIMSTKLDVEPKTLLEKILTDADLSHLSKPYQQEKSELLRQEVKAVCGRNISKVDWLQNDINFMLEHVYHTQYAKDHFQVGKVKNLQDVVSKQKSAIESKQLKRELKKLERANLKQQAKLNNERGIQTLFRITLRNHINLSAIADNKANIMLSVNAIIISLLVTTLSPNYDQITMFIVPVIIMILTSAASILLAIKSTRPKVDQKSSGFSSKMPPRQVNLLFFGSFNQLDLEEYEAEFNNMIESRADIYQSMIHDLYYLGKVLSMKYKFLNLTYNVFSIGFILAILSFFFILVTQSWLIS